MEWVRKIVKLKTTRIMKNKRNKLVLILSMLLIHNVASAQSSMSSVEAFYIVSGFVLVVSVLVLAVALVVLQVLRAFVKKELDKTAEVEAEEVEEEPSWWKKMLTKANDAVPVEQEREIILDHNYDGIRELDNHLPPWWKWLFYVTIIFGVVYIAVYHVFGTMPLQTEEYQAEMAIAEEQRLERLANQPASDIDESNVEFVQDAQALSQGKSIFNLNCAACHKEDGGGGIGPNLTDEYWIHGGSIQDVFRTIKVGVPEKGMISWEVMLSPDQMQNVSSYVLTLQGTTPANPKEPQGEIYNAEVLDDEVEEEIEIDSANVELDSTRMASVN